AFGRKVFALYVGKWGRRYAAHLEVAGSWENADADRLIRRFVAMIEALPPKARKHWDAAQSKAFNVGIEAANASPTLEVRLPPGNITAGVRVNGSIAIHVYAPTRMPPDA